MKYFARNTKPRTNHRPGFFLILLCVEVYIGSHSRINASLHLGLVNHFNNAFSYGFVSIHRLAEYGSAYFSLSVYL